MSEPKKMERPRIGRKLAGVCAAIANYANIDVTVVRVAYTLLTIFTAFSGAIVYLILMLIIPEEENRYLKND
ncbi:MAG: PspC domain-containing protein [Bacteroidaceae bacterium]|nr:PspC domain-containing protein [Bacteroidaceae bacterium]MBR5842646.1 PspC domain-containing protein [Bacteroidaceae bacterium]